MKRREKLLATFLVLGVLGAVGGFGVFAAFSATTSNSANTITAGTVALDDNDTGSALYAVANAKPGVAAEKCIRVTYTGSLDAEVRLSTPSTLGPLAQYLTLEIQPGTQAAGTFPSCTGFVAAAGPALYSGDMDQFATRHDSWANGLSVGPDASGTWTTNSSVVYRVTVTVKDTDDAQGKTTGLHELKWEARNK